MKRDEQQRKSRHDLRLKTVKAVVDSTSPLSSTARITNAKKIQLLEDKLTEIERENRILYEKMLKIRNKTPTPSINSGVKSLNGTSRKIKLEEINHANSEFFNRLKKKQSTYKLEKFATERRRTEKILSIISEFPQIRSTKKKNTTPLKQKITKNEPSSGNLVFRQGKIINFKSYLVEIYKNSDNYRIVAFDLENPVKLMLHLLPSEVQECCGPDLDFKKLVKILDLANGSLILTESISLSSLS